MDSDVFAFVVLMGAVVLRLVLIGGVIWWIIPRRKACPHCGGATFGLVTSTFARHFRMEQRWCPCGWAGWSKRVPATAPGMLVEMGTEDGRVERR